MNPEFTVLVTMIFATPLNELVAKLKAINRQYESLNKFIAADPVAEGHGKKLNFI